MKQRRFADIKEYFKDRPEDLLVLTLGKGEGWPELCTFLGKPVPDVDFPSANRTKRGFVAKTKRRIRSLLKRN